MAKPPLRFDLCNPMPADIEEVIERFHSFDPILLHEQDDITRIHHPVAKSYILKCALGSAGSYCKLSIGFCPN